MHTRRDMQRPLWAILPDTSRIDCADAFCITEACYLGRVQQSGHVSVQIVKGRICLSENSKLISKESSEAVNILYLRVCRIPNPQRSKKLVTRRSRL